MDRKKWIDLLQNGLQKNLPYFQNAQFAKSSKEIVEASVLALWGFEDGTEEPQLLLTRRSQNVPTHKGHYAFPGGKRHDEDEESDPLETSKATALRETHEETGLDPESFEIIGHLPILPTLSSGYWVRPWVGVLKEAVSKQKIDLDPGEMEWAGWIPLSSFQNPLHYRLDRFESNGQTFATHVYTIETHRIWGATAAMIHNLLSRLEL